MDKLKKLAESILNFRGKASSAIRFWIFLAFLMGTAPVTELSAQGSARDTVTTPFRKGRWLSGLNGSFSSNILKLESTEDLYATNSYGIEIFSGKFFRDRWFVGFNVIALGSSSSGLIERESESLVIGPSLSHYFLKEPYGSLYASILPGYIRVREEGSVVLDEQVFNQDAEGPGFATRLRLGYSYVISRRIVLDVGVGTNLAWLNVSYDSDIEGGTQKESIFSTGTFFSFGFNVLLDEFFF